MELIANFHSHIYNVIHTFSVCLSLSLSLPPPPPSLSLSYTRTCHSHFPVDTDYKVHLMDMTDLVKDFAVKIDNKLA